MKGLKGITFAILSSATFGLIAFFSIPMMKDGIAPSTILFYRFLFSSLLMGGVCLVKKESIKINIKQLRDISWLGVLYAITALLLIYSYRYIPSGIATTIHFMYPILVGILMVFLFKEQKSLVILFAAIASVLGVVLLCWEGSGSVQPIGVFIAALTVVSYAGYIVGVNQSKVGHLSADVLTFYILTAGAILFFFYMLCDTGGIPTIPDSSAFIRILGLAIFCTVISDLTLILAIQYIGSTITSILGSMEPLVAVLVGVLYFSEQIDVYGFLGIALIIASVTLVVSKKRKKNTLAEEKVYSN